MIRKIDKIITSQPTSDGAGVKLRRVFGFHEEGLFDPFLLLDFFGSDNPNDFIAGFPWHPHRGIETVTYMLEGAAEHQDSMGNKGVIRSGDVQWMTAGSGIIHQEMPKAVNGRMYGFQLWSNLPKSHKMMPPRYQDIPASAIPEVLTENGVLIKIVAGEFNGVAGPVREIISDPVYFDVSVPAGTTFSVPVNSGHTVFAFVFEGEAGFGEGSGGFVGEGKLAKLVDGDAVEVVTGEKAVRFLLVAGKPLGEPVAWRGPIVMNTEAELDVAFREFRMGTFIK